MATTTVTIRSEAPIGTISPRIYGHFAEHLGRCCYDGLWVGHLNTNLAQFKGFRKDVVDALKELPVPLLRWPGGCYADHYHWRDGVGPRDQRPIRLGMSCGLQVEDDNSLGTDEFMALCKELGAEPYLAGNMGSGSPQELADWIEYCNTPLRTSLGRLREANGSPEPYGVKLWGVGNENWGCGGHYEAAHYGQEFVRYATMLRHVDPSAELVICGHEREWNETLIKTVAKRLDMVDHYSIHRYWVKGGPEVDFNEEQYYALLSEAEATEDFIRETAALLRAAITKQEQPPFEAGSKQSEAPLVLEKPNGEQHRIGIALDEWGVWHPEARPWGPNSELSRSPITYEQANTLRDALAAAVALEGFHRQCNVLSLANLAQIVNVLQSVIMTEGDQIFLTPTYHALRLHKPHLGATALPVDVSGGPSLPNGSSAVSATASQNGDSIAITLINRHISESASVRIDGAAGTLMASGEILTADSPNATNSFENPNRVSPKALNVAQDGDGWLVELPPHSMATISF